MSVNTAEKMLLSVSSYFEACNTGIKKDFVPLFHKNAAHYLPKGMFGPLLDVESLFNQWQEDARKNRAHWILEKAYADEKQSTAIAEWTAVKTAQNIHYRGVDIFEFDSNGYISEVRVYYATARDPNAGPNELGGYDYSTNGWWQPLEKMHDN